VCGSTDMRKAIDGLSNIVVYELLQEPCSDQLFVFCGRRRDRLKILQWVNNGFWLHYKRLEKGTFHWPGIDDKQLGLIISARQLNWLLEGLPLQQDHAHLRYRDHDCLNIITTFYSYGDVTDYRQAELLKNLAIPRTEATPEIAALIQQTIMKILNK